MMHKLASLDLRLLELFEVLEAQRSVSRAAEVLDLPQPVVSQGLRRLRLLFDDDLFVRAGGGMAPTATAIELREPVAAMLAIAREKLLPAPRFDPAQSTREFCIVATDFGAVSVLPQLMPRLLTVAPNASLRFLPLDREVFDRLTSLEADLAVGILPAVPAAIRTQIVFRDRYVCALRADHPALRPALTRAAFRGAEHVVISSRFAASADGDARIAGVLDGCRIALVLPNYAALSAILARTDLLAVVPQSATRVFLAERAITTVDLPFDVPEIVVVAAWHERRETDVGRGWLLAMVAEAITGSQSGGAQLPP